ncbi:MAG: DNA polymerase III subunit delta, partial [Planctomycetota bacterium]
MPRQHAFDFLTDASSTASASDVAIVVGNDASMRRWSIDAIVGESDWTQFDGESVQWSDLSDDLATASLFDFGGDERRTLVIRSADPFVKSHRSQLEDYVVKPGGATRLVVELESLASNTRLYKAADQSQMLVLCGNSNDAKRGVTTATRAKFLTGYVAGRHQAKLTTSAASALIELVGEDIGMLDTEIAKLALYVAVGDKIDEQLVREIVAGWKGKTVWQITDAIAAGDAAEALRQLDKLFGSGQRAIALLPQIAWSLRRLGLATAVIEHRERSNRSWQFNDALAAAGIRQGFQVQTAKKQLQTLGRARAKQLLPWLLDADLRLKGT